MAVVTSPAIVLHAFDYLESSRILRFITRDAGLRSAVARGARKSRKRFGGGLDLFAQGAASFHTKPGRDLDTLTAFEDPRPRPGIAGGLERFTGAEAIAEIVLRFGAGHGDALLFDAVAGAFDALSLAPPADARAETLRGAWHVVATLGHAPIVDACAECGSGIDDAPALFAHAAGGVLCPRCATLSAGGRKLPASARAAIAAWSAGAAASVPSDTEGRAHQRLLREFLEYHLHDGRSLQAYDLWEGAAWPAA